MFLPSYNLEHMWCNVPDSGTTRCQWQSLQEQVVYLPFLPWCTSGIMILSSYTLDHKRHIYPFFIFLGTEVAWCSIKRGKIAKMEQLKLEPPSALVHMIRAPCAWLRRLTSWGKGAGTGIKGYVLNLQPGPCFIISWHLNKWWNF